VVLEEGSYILRHCVVEDNSHLLSYGIEMQTRNISPPPNIAPYKNHAKRDTAYLSVSLFIFLLFCLLPLVACGVFVQESVSPLCINCPFVYVPQFRVP
jgi:hypothetical protein